MFFWFANNETFSIINALMQLILVITGSALIICFCHKLTNFKKSRRYKYDLAASGCPGVSGISTGQDQAGITATRYNQLNPTAAAANLNPYNTVRPFGAGNCLNGHSFQVHLLGAQGGGVLPANSAPNAYGYHNPEAAAAAALGRLAALQGLDQQQQQVSTAPIYSTTVHPDCSGFQANQIEPPHLEESCPSYEEAIAASVPLAVASDDQQPQVDDQQTNGSQNDGATQ